MKPADRVGKIPPRRDLELDAIVDVLEKRTDKHDEQIQELAKLSQSLASSVKVLNWITGILSGGVLTWVVTQILSLISK